MEQVLTTVGTVFEMVVEWAILLCELIGVAVIVVTVIKGVILWIKKDPHVKLMIAEGIALALTFKMGGELLRSVIVREWSELLILGAIIVLRALMAALIHFEIRSERHLLGDAAEENPREMRKPPVVKL
jgi:uncharacterized membrane protein